MQSISPRASRRSLSASLFLAPCLALLCAASAHASEGEPRRALVLEGFVLAPDGSPVEGAVVVSSAGGRAVTDVAGNYWLEVEVPDAATEVQITAQGRAGRNLAASTSVRVSTAQHPTRVDPLQLARGTSCVPSWLPTFGTSLDGEVSALAWHDEGGGPALYAGGRFTKAGEVTANQVVRWDGSNWASLDIGISGLNSRVFSMASYDEGNGPALFVGGRFAFAGTVAVRNLARWNGSSWSSLGDGPAGVVRSLLVHDDGSGPALYVGGSFFTVAGVSTLPLVRWDGASWSPVGPPAPWTVFALAEFDDGSGPALYAGGSFGVRRWDGASWTQLDSGIPGSVTALAVFDDGAGPKLYAGGAFATAGGINARNLASWDGSGWAAVGSGTNDEVLALLAHDDGGGMALHVGGRFSIAGGLSASRLARWDGTSWSALGGGVAGRVAALVSGEAGGVPALYAGGNLTGTDTGDLHLARWGCLDTSAPVLACPTPFAVLDRARNGIGEVVSFTIDASDDFDPAPVVVCVPPSGSVFPLGTTLVDCTATDASGNSSSCQFAVTVQSEVRQQQR